jgi:hypothetical protein
MAGKASKAARKKLRTSKHVLKAQDEQQKQVVIKGSSNSNKASEFAIVENPNQKVAQTAKSPAKIKAATKVAVSKDPSEASTYLMLWEQHKKNGTDWKFNKNNQSWLIRHMYETEKVSKTTFSLLMEYFGGLEGKAMRLRIRAEGSRRALRYKEYEKEQQDEKATETSSKELSAQEVTKNTGISKQEQDEDAMRWKKIDDNDKRKEYKRARQVLEVMKEQ